MATNFVPFSKNITYLNDDQTAQDDTLFHTIKITKDMVYQGNLLLVNRNYPVHPDSVKSDFVNLYEHKGLVNGYELLHTDIHLSKEITQRFSHMIQDAKKDKVTHFMISSGYRNFNEQDRLYEEKGTDYALPAGYSEHNLGLSLDVGSTAGKMEHAPEGKWLKENAWKYGFIMRYPEDKTAITKIQYEPWHIRYVGLPHSLIMHDKNLALEEYISFLKKEKTISLRYNKVNYSISYYPISQHTHMKVPIEQHYEISGNNVDGIIITVMDGKKR